MLKKILILIVSSFIFNLIFGIILSRYPDLFLPLQKKVAKTKARNTYKFMVLIVAAMTVVFLQEMIDLNEIVSLIILGFSLSLSGIIFRDINKEI